MSRAPRPRGPGRLMAGLSLVVGIATLLFLAPAHDKGGASLDATTEAGPGAAALREGFEPRDVVTRSVGLAMIIGVAVIALSIAGLFAFLALLHRQDAAAPPLTPQQTAAIVPPGPPLQSDPLGDIAALRRREASQLSSYRWLSPARTAAVIPIERAMALVVGKPLDPAPSAGATP